MQFNKMGSGKFGFPTKKDKVNMDGAAVDISVKEKCRKILQKKLKKTEKQTQKTEPKSKERKIWWNQCNSCK